MTDTLENKGQAVLGCRRQRWGRQGGCVAREHCRLCELAHALQHSIRRVKGPGEVGPEQGSFPP